MNSDKSEKFNLLKETLKNDFSNENLHNVIIDYCLENDIEIDLINFYKENMANYPEICKQMLEKLSDRSVQRLYNTKIKTKSQQESKKTLIKLILILLAAITAMFFIWKGLLSSFKTQLLQ
ncbi:MAG: hypothetical protein N2746_06820 [Deltaproteobacteria bacterium]|nr:hypothetical protein [Deltaproteobacteria bacterium]